MKVSYSLQDVADLFGKQSKPWWIAGGWAIDLFLGEETRKHDDIDITILREDEKHFREFLDSWEIWPGLGNDGLADQPIETYQDLKADINVLWCRESAQSPWAFELLTSQTEDNMWIFKRDDRIRLPITEIGNISSNGLPYLKSEIILLFKAKNVLEKDQKDFDAVVSKLENPKWLKQSLELVHPGHKWLTQL